jgi:hypothetical protein
VGFMFLNEDEVNIKCARVDEFVTEVAEACDEFGGYDPKRGDIEVQHQRDYSKVLGWIYQAWADQLLIAACGMYKFSPAEQAFLDLLPSPPLSFRHRRIVRGLFDRAVKADRECWADWR